MIGTTSSRLGILALLSLCLSCNSIKDKVDQIGQEPWPENVHLQVLGARQVFDKNWEVKFKIENDGDGPFSLQELTEKQAKLVLSDFTMEASLAVARSTGSRTSPYHNSVIDETNHERHFMSGIPLRTGLGIGQGTLGFELGAIAGVGWTDAQSNMCSHESGLRPILGGYLGPVLRIGGRYPTRLSVQVQSAWPISARCTNVPHDGSERNAPTWFTDPPPDPSLLAQVAVPLW